MKKIYILLAILFILNGFDYITTIQALASGAYEGNPIAAYFISRDALHYLKIAGLGLLSIYLIIRAKYSAKSRARIARVLLWADVAFGLIVSSNIIVNFVQQVQ